MGRRDRRPPGRPVNGYLAEENVESVGEVLPWLQEAIAYFYPNSTYARSLDAEVRERAARRTFLPPRIGARVRCHHCGAPNPAPGMDDGIAFYCSRCANSVHVEEAKVN